MATSANYDLGNILSPLTDATSNSAVKSIATLALSYVGFKSWVFACDNPKAIFGISHIMSGIPIQWIVAYAVKGYLKIDPIIKHCRESEEAFLWDATEGWDLAEDNVKEFMWSLQANGFGSGMAISLRSSTGKMGILSIVSPQPLVAKRENYLQNLPSARTIGMALHAAIDRIALE